jgi:5-oxoprolinase (ATP-hydrolysing)
LGFIRMANESMARPIRNVTEARGFATNAHNLVTFGGAGGQHACAIARSLGIPRILIHKYSSILSAYGIGLADVVSDFSEPSTYTFSMKTLPKILSGLAKLCEKVKNDLNSQRVDSSRIAYENYLSMRYEGTDTNLSIPQPVDNDFEKSFVDLHRREFAFDLANRAIIVDAIRVRGIGKGIQSKDSTSLFEELESGFQPVFNVPESSRYQKVYLDSGWTDTPVYLLNDLSPGCKFNGPALIIDNTQTILVEPESHVVVLSSHLVVENSTWTKPGDREFTVVNPVQLSTFGHRFMSIAEQMGNTLQRTSISTSIKERLDFSCAIFSADAKLVANAPHIPIHLGSMQFAIQYQHALWRDKLSPGDVLMTNHPEAGGTHLPDITVITPMFKDKEIIFYVASRGHHSDIGGIGITSMVPDSKELWQEGLAVKSMRIVSRGSFKEAEIRDLFELVADHPGCSASRRINDNISDLKAQVSANERGVSLLQQLCHEYGVPYLQFYMAAIQLNAETAIRNFLKETHIRFGGKQIRAIDYYDDGTPVAITITINPEDGSAIFDFEGTGAETYGNMNSPISITHSAVIYCLRCLIDLDIPLNQGCLNPIDIRIPKGTILNPSEFVAICGSTIASQRVSDVIFKAFESCAASQGCGNSFGWGSGGKDAVTGKVIPGWNYSEALGGGSGAGPTWNGAHGVNVHSTNTKTTDPEVIEKRTPVIVRRYELREGTGGNGLYRGGNGVKREIEARVPLKFSILSERRVYSPYGLNGGQDGSVGKNYWIRRAEDGSEQWISLGGKAVVTVRAGDRLQINTPGGGGWGKPLSNGTNSDSRPRPTIQQA